jgi:hypothetical protein
MSIGNLKTEGNKGNNFPWQLKMLIGQQCACDALNEIADNTDTVEPLLTQILAAIQQGTDYEAALVVDANDVTWLEIRVWNGVTFDPPVYYLAGSNTSGIPLAPITYINPNTYLAQIVSNTTGLATETTLGAIDSNVSTLVTNTTGLSQEATQLLIQALLITIDADTSNLDVALSTVATETTLGSVDTKLTSAVRTPNFLRPSGSLGTIAAGTFSMSFASVGTGNATVGGMILKPGETLNFDAGALNNTLGAVAYDTLTNVGAELIIITLT